MKKRKVLLFYAFNKSGCDVFFLSICVVSLLASTLHMIFESVRERWTNAIYMFPWEKFMFSQMPILIFVVHRQITKNSFCFCAFMPVSIIDGKDSVRIQNTQNEQSSIHNRNLYSGEFVRFFLWIFCHDVCSVCAVCVAIFLLSCRGQPAQMHISFDKRKCVRHSKNDHFV